MERASAVRIVALAVGVFFVALGLWAFFMPESFFERMAAFPPYNRHFIHDIGAFQIGLGAVLILGARWADGLLVALAGTAVGFVFHFIAHVIDMDAGGRATDPVSLGLIALVVALAAFWRAKDRQPS